MPKDFKVGQVLRAGAIDLEPNALEGTLGAVHKCTAKKVPPIPPYYIEFVIGHQAMKLQSIITLAR